MLREITWAQFREWQAYFELELAGESRADARAAYIVRALYNINRDHKKNSEPYPIGTFIYDFLNEIKEAPPKPKQTPAQQKALILEHLMAAAHAERNKPSKTWTPNDPKRRNSRRVRRA